MKLYYSTTSPYTRRVCAAAILLELDSQLEKIVVSPFDAPAELTQVNPLSQIPTLQLDNNEMLCGSALITEYLIGNNEQSANWKLNDWAIRNLAGIAEGIVDAALNAVLETRRPDELQSPEKIAGQQEKILRSLSYLEQQSSTTAGTLSSDQINFYTLMLGVCLGYLDFRQAELNWRDHAPKLSAWYAEVENQAWLSETRPPQQVKPINLFKAFAINHEKN